jgi:hypothetical protein
MAATGAMQRGNPIWRGRSVVTDLPLLRQLGHRVQLVFDHPQVPGLDGVVPADATRWQAPLAEGVRSRMHG